ncbi:SMI1/KNR4 family protein [Streptomyces buecherae]|uniref:SMI1/KNR4 family protein n=1 Tax=Streptomyces buecherae TaxID=2763006 RepID=A0A7H8NC97_9ACTN|nr:SMI1/KNR4 family protein [Streptomyces buecherae]QKW52130.1 SMI1/KNR4 family protein [Streptomyces buecherae]
MGHRTGNDEVLDIQDLWDDSPYALRDYVEDTPPTPELIAELEAELGGYRLPRSYVALMRAHNGGVPNRAFFPLPGVSSPDQATGVAVNGVYGIGRTKPNSLGGEFGSRFWIEEWEYPDLGVYFADTPSAGHDMLAFDYRAHGRTGEPTVVHVDQEDDFRVTPLAENFTAFVRGLVEWRGRARAGTKP